MDVESLRIFIEVARRGSFAAVARDRNLDPSSISRLVSSLEDELGFRLFQRTTRRMQLTEAGELYLNRMIDVVEEIERARNDALSASDRPQGTLRLTVSVALGQTWLLPLLPRFTERYPALKLELLLTDSNLDLVSERIDLAIRLAPRIQADVERTKLFDTRYRVCASPDYLQCSPSLRQPDDLKQHSCLLFDLPEFRSQWIFRTTEGAVFSVAVDGDVVISSALAIRDCALAGMGPALLADWLIQPDLHDGRLMDVFPEHDVTATEFETAAWMLYPTRKFLPKKVEVMAEYLTSMSLR